MTDGMAKLLVSLMIAMTIGSVLQTINAWRMGTISREWQLSIQADIFKYCPGPKEGGK